MLRAVLVVALIAGALTAAPASADAGCAPAGTPPPPGAETISYGELAIAQDGVQQP